MSICSIRGAITIKYNESEEIIKNTKFLLEEIIIKNNIDFDEIISVLFSATKDITAAYPAVAARELGITNAGLMCFQEMDVEDSLKMCIRVLVNIDTYKSQKEMKHIYLKDAKILRPDLNNKHIAIAIDGPSGSGKSTVAKLIAKELGYIYADTGAIYRTVALYCIDNNIDFRNSKAVEKNLDKINISLKHEDETQKIYLNEKDVTDIIRTQKVAEGASHVAAVKGVRENLLNLQRNIAKKNNVVMDGRDIGTFVLPYADIKIYLDADVKERAKRRCGELAEKGIKYDYYKVKEEIIKRDNHDKNRDISPLKKAEDAVFIDTTDKNIDEVKKEILNLINEKL